VVREREEAVREVERERRERRAEVGHAWQSYSRLCAKSYASLTHVCKYTHLTTNHNGVDPPTPPPTFLPGRAADGNCLDRTRTSRVTEGPCPASFAVGGAVSRPASTVHC
jgi:hypothetical protein